MHELRILDIVNFKVYNNGLRTAFVGITNSAVIIGKISDEIPRVMPNIIASGILPMNAETINTIIILVM